MRHNRLLAASAALLMLAGCGGGSGGGSGGGGGSPVGSQSGLVIPNTSGARVIADSNGNGTNVRYTSGGSASVTFNGTTRTWSNPPKVEGNADIVTSADGKTVVVTSRGTTTGRSNLEHTQFGVWMDSNAGDLFGNTSNGVTSGGFLIGDPTPVSEMPGSGSATYRGTAVAVELRDGVAPRALEGSLTARANFDTGIVDATAQLRGTNDNRGFGSVDMNGLAIAGNKFAGSASSARGHSGTAEGGFTGPAAAELGGVFELNGPSRVEGAFGGKK